MPAETPAPEDPPTSLMCPECHLRVGRLDDTQPLSEDELAFHCLACAHRWVWRDPDSTEQPDQSTVQRCPACHRPMAKLLEHTSKEAAVNYYRCEGCVHVWTTSKKDGSFVRHVTPLAASRRRLVSATIAMPYK